jgi:hypothetical protein
MHNYKTGDKNISAITAALTNRAATVHQEHEKEHG